MEEEREVSSGVRELIARLRDDGVKAGREKPPRFCRKRMMRPPELWRMPKLKRKKF